MKKRQQFDVTNPLKNKSDQENDQNMKSPSIIYAFKINSDQENFTLKLQPKNTLQNHEVGNNF